MDDKKPWEVAAEKQTVKTEVKPWEAAVEKKSPAQPVDASASVSETPVSQPAEPLSTSGTEVEELPQGYKDNRLNPRGTKYLKDQQHYFTGAFRNGEPIVKQWNQDAQEFQQVTDRNIILDAKNKFGKPIETPKGEITPEDKGETKEQFVENRALQTFYDKEKIADDAAVVHGRMEELATQPQINKYYQLLDVYKQGDEGAKQLISTQIDELLNQPFDYTEPLTPIENKKFNLKEPLMDVPKFKTVAEAVDYTNTQQTEGRALLSDYAESDRVLQQANKEYQSLSPSDPKGFFYNFTRALQEHSDALSTANKIALASDEEALNQLERNYIKGKIFSHPEAEGLGAAGEFAGSMVSSIAPTIAASSAATALTGNPITGTIAGGLYAAQDAARIAYANGMQQMYNELRDKNTNQNIAFSDAKTFAKQSAANQGISGFATGMVAPVLRGTSQAMAKTGTEIAKKVIKDIVVDAGIDFTTGTATTAMDNYLATKLGSERGVWDGALEAGALSTLGGTLVNIATNGVPSVSKYVTEKRKGEIINSLANLPQEQLQGVYEQAKEQGANPVEVDELKKQVSDLNAVLTLIPEGTPNREKILPLAKRKMDLLNGDNSVMPEQVKIAEIEAIDREILELSGIPLTEKETKEYEKLIEKKEQKPAEWEKKVQLTDSEKDKLKHFENRIEEHKRQKKEPPQSEDKKAWGIREPEESLKPSTDEKEISTETSAEAQGGETESRQNIQRSPPETPDNTELGQEEVGGTKKTIVTKRAYEGEIREGVKKELEVIGLTREIETHEEARQIAKNFIDKVGVDNALDAVRNGDVEGAPAAYVWDAALQETEKRLLTETDPVKQNKLEKQQADLFEEFGKKALAGGRFSSALGDIYKKSEINYNAEAKIREYKEQNGGEIPADVEAKFRKLDAELKEVKKKLAIAEEEAKKANEQAAITAIKESATRKRGLYGKQRIAKGLDDLGLALGAKLSATGEERVKIEDALTEIGRGLIEAGLATLDNVGQKIREYIQDKYNVNVDDYEANIIATLSTEDISIPHSLIRDLVSRGVDNIEDLVAAVKQRYPNKSDREIRDAITGYGKIVNPNKEEIEVQIRKMKRIGRVISALEDVQAKKRPLRSGRQRDLLDAEERALNKELREAMKELPVDEETLDKQLKTALDATKSRIRNQIEDLEREIDTKEQVPKSARSVKADDELKELIAKRDELKKQHEAIFKDEEFKDKKRLEAAKKRADRSISELQRRLREGDFSKKVTKSIIADSELIKLNAEKLRLQEEFDKELYKNQLQNRSKAEKAKEVAWEAWNIPRILMATGEFSFVGVQGLIQTVAHPVYGAKAMKNALQFMASEKRTEDWLRTVRSQEWYPALKKSKLALTEPNAELTAREELFYSGWTNMIWDGIGKVGALPVKLKSQSAYESAVDVWSKLNPFKAVERAAIGYLDTIRVMRFLDGMQMLQMKGKDINNPNDVQNYKDLGDMINTMTGRASLGKAELIAPMLSKVFFSPRNWASGIKTATPYALYHFGKMTSTARKMAIADFSKFVGLTTGVVATAAAALNNDDDPETGVEFDPRSSDFMKIKLGDRRVDPWGGKQQQVVLSARIFADALMKGLPEDKRLDFMRPEGAYKKGDELYPLGQRGKVTTPSAGRIIGQQALNKLNPTASLLYNYLNVHPDKEGQLKDDYGKPYTLENQLSDKFNPIFWGTVSDLIKDDPTALNGLLAFYAFFGGGVQVYEEKKVEQKRTKKPSRKRN